MVFAMNLGENKDARAPVAALKLARESPRPALAF